MCHDDDDTNRIKRKGKHDLRGTYVEPAGERLLVLEALANTKHRVTTHEMHARMYMYVLDSPVFAAGLGPAGRDNL